MSREWDKIIGRILREAGGPGVQHEQLKADLTTWAVERGFSKAYSGFQNGNRPDVLRGTPDDRYLFVGDAKDSEHETVDNGETVARIASYIRDFAEHLGNPGYRGGYIAIATDNLAAGHAWVPALNLLA